MIASEQPPAALEQQPTFGEKVESTVFSLDNHIPTFDEFTVAHDLAGQMDFDKKSGTYTGPDGNFVDTATATKLWELASESTWLLDGKQQLAMQKTQHALDGTLREKSQSWLALDGAIRQANKKDAQEHAEKLHQERLDLLAKKDERRLNEVRDQQLAKMSKKRTEELLWSTAFKNGGTRLHDRVPELKEFVRREAEKQAVAELKENADSSGKARQKLERADAIAVNTLKREKEAHVTELHRKPRVRPEVSPPNRTDADKGGEPVVVSKERRAKLQLIGNRIGGLLLARLLAPDLEATKFQRRVAGYVKEKAPSGYYKRVA